MNRDTGFFASLFDLSFSHFITTKLLKWVYIAWLGVAALAGLAYLGMSLGRGFTSIVMALVLVPIGLLFAAILIRIGVELTIVMFRIAENTAQTSDEAATIARNTARTGTA